MFFTEDMKIYYSDWPESHTISISFSDQEYLFSYRGHFTQFYVYFSLRPEESFDPGRQCINIRISFSCWG